MSLDRHLRLTAEVRDALAQGRGVVALETTILSFGLPRPVNERVAAQCDAAIREAACVPATLALLDGQVCAGLSPEETQMFCEVPPGVEKVNLQNLAAVLGRRVPGALTVAACLAVCHGAGIRVFATGGIGGVHRGYAKLLDISSDLTGLARYPAVCVSSGAKSILDVAATVEALETLGIPVVGYGTDWFPQFYSRSSEFPVTVRLDTPAEVAAFCRRHLETCGTGVIVAVPVAEELEIPEEVTGPWIHEAELEAAREGVSGRDLTPFLLARLEAHSGGRTLVANEALAVANASVAAEIAAEIAASGQRPVP